VSIHHGHAEAMTPRFARDGHTSNSGCPDLSVVVREAKEDRLVRHCGCRCADG
jgi:hypothetical protein